MKYNDKSTDAGMTPEQLNRMAEGMIEFERLADSGATLEISFPVPVKQVSAQSVLVPVTRTDCSMFSVEFAEHVERKLGKREAAAFFDRMIQYVDRRLIIEQIS